MATIVSYLPPDSSILSTTDSSSSVGWLHQTSFGLDQPLHEAMSCWLAQMAIDRKFALNVQHLKGIHNVVADILSCRFHLSNIEMLTFLHSKHSKQIPRHFCICLLPQEITAWVFLTMQRTRESGSVRPKQPTRRSMTEHGADGLSTASTMPR